MFISSLTLKHVYPTFEGVIANIGRQSAPGARLVFDLIEADPENLVLDLARTWAGRSLPDRNGSSRASGADPSRVASSLRMVTSLLRGASYGYFEPDRVTFIRKYSRRGVAEIVRRSGLSLLAFDEVRHDRDHRRLLVVAERPRDSPP